ncbi:MAG: DUF2807 domain-containing protein [Treponema sp.]|jgi:hypothetical protein|nr:DUF2807 domain-containing protein [Treponema sp.]
MRILGLIGIIAACMGTAAGAMGLAGNGDIRHVERDLLAFNHINFTGVGDVFVHLGNEYRVGINVDSNIEPYIVTNVRDGTLYISTNLERYKNLRNPIKFKLRFDVYTRDIESVSHMGMGNIELIDMNIDALTLNHSGVGFFTVTGKGTQFVVQMKGVGDINSENFAVKRASITNIGVGKVKVWAEELLEVFVHPFGISSMEYRGDPTKLVSNNWHKTIKM